MVEFLIKRPIAVSMTFIAILVLGVFAMKFIPVSLMPDIDIPEITVQISVDNTPARELESTVVQPIRRQLMQVSHLADITSETRNESGIINLRFDYGTDIDFAFIEVNEKIDRAMNYLPRNIDRPKVIKANASDIPVFYLNLTTSGSKVHNTKPGSPKSNGEASGTPTQTAGGDQMQSVRRETNAELFPVSQKFTELSRFASNVIRKRIEQLPEVAMVDMSGMVSPELLIIPDNQKLESLGITQDNLENQIENNNIKLGNLLIRDGQYQYNIRFSSTLQNKKDIENIYLKVDDRLLQLKDVARVVEHPQKQKGKVLYNGQDAVTIAVIKQSDARMADLKKKLNDLIGHFEKDYPDIQFNITRNQTQLLDYSISNLDQSLVLGAILAFLIMFLFLQDLKAPLLIGITIPTSLVISMLFFYLMNISLNIISLSGIILGVGMMVDNSIIVIDNITQHRERLKRQKKLAGPPESTEGQEVLNDQTIKTGSFGQDLDTACVNGTNEVFRPMLSSVLTTCAVFIPLIFISGITGALFYDQAMAITVGLLVSLAVSVTLLPVYYRLLYGKNKMKEGAGSRFLKRLGSYDFEKLYVKGFLFVMKRQGMSWLIVGLMLLGAIVLYKDLEKSKLPPITRDETLLLVDWNERIHIDENRRRTEELISRIDSFLTDNTCLIGEQQFILEQSNAATSSEVVIYLKTKHPRDLEPVIHKAAGFLRDRYPESFFSFKEAGNIFNMIFSDDGKPLVARLRAVDDFGPNRVNFLQNILARIRVAFPKQAIDPLPLYEYTVLRTDPAKLLLYDVTFDAVYGKLKSAFNENQLFLITDNQDFVPVILGDQQKTIQDIIKTLFIRNGKDELIPVRDLLTETKGHDLKTITAGKEGEYYPVPFDIDGKQVKEVMKKVRQVVTDDRNYEVSFTGSILTNRELMKELALILMVSLALLYFILASQFESLTLPLIVLMEVPIDIFGAFLALKLDGETINLMSLIGIVVMSGIVINDSILKIDTINQLRRQGYPLLRAMAEAGHRRLKPILMTSLTTILALVPTLFMGGLGSDLQRPLALAVIGGMTFGTLISLYLVPLGYYYLKRDRRAKMV